MAKVAHCLQSTRHVVFSMFCGPLCCRILTIRSKEIWDPCRWVVPMLGSLVARSPRILALPCLRMISFRKKAKPNMNPWEKNKKHGWFVKGVDVFLSFLGGMECMSEMILAIIYLLRALSQDILVVWTSYFEPKHPFDTTRCL